MFTDLKKAVDNASLWFFMQSIQHVHFSKGWRENETVLRIAKTSTKGIDGIK